MDSMKKNRLGQTDLTVSAIGLGTVKFGRNEGVRYPHSFALPTDQDILNLLSDAKELGINLLDTAPAYGTSETRLGSLLVGQREDWVLCSKAGEEFVEGNSFFDFSAKAIRHSVERSLKRLKTDYIDILLIHSDGNDCHIIEIDQVFLTLEKLKQAGMIRAYGMSTKTIAGGMLAVEQSDVVMVTYNPLQAEEQAVIRHAESHQKGVLIKKALASGHLQKIAEKNPVQTALKFIFQEKGVSSVIIGTLNPVHLKEVVII